MALLYPHVENQPYEGTLVDKSPIVTNAMLPFVGQLGPAAYSTISNSHGRRLAGFGQDEVLPQSGDPSKLPDAEDWHDSSLRQLEEDDDVVGSGVFDTGGPRGRQTVHEDMGVFQDHPSIPGFIARNPPYTQNTEVLDVVTGGPTVEVAGGGLFYIERDGRPAPVPTKRLGGGYVQLNDKGVPAAPLQWAPPVNRLPEFAHVAEDFKRAKPPAGAEIITRPIVNVANVSMPISGLGAEQPAAAKEAPGWGWWLVGGLAIGIGGGIAYRALSKKR